MPCDIGEAGGGDETQKSDGDHTHTYIFRRILYTWYLVFFFVRLYGRLLRGNRGCKKAGEDGGQGREGVEGVAILIMVVLESRKTGEKMSFRGGQSDGRRGEGLIGWEADVENNRKRILQR